MTAYDWYEDATPQPVQDSGQREDFATGSRRDIRTGKGRMDLLPPRALLRLARHFEAGAVKYGDRNWELGQPQSRFMDSGLRHAMRYLMGDDDEDHLAAAVWNLLCALDQEERAGTLPDGLIDVGPKSLP